MVAAARRTCRSRPRGRAAASENSALPPHCAGRISASVTRCIAGGTALFERRVTGEPFLAVFRRPSPGAQGSLQTCPPDQRACPGTIPSRHGHLVLSPQFMYSPIQPFQGLNERPRARLLLSSCFDEVRGGHRWRGDGHCDEQGERSSASSMAVQARYRAIFCVRILSPRLPPMFVACANIAEADTDSGASPATR
jgi:hypothetical protein